MSGSLFYDLEEIDQVAVNLFYGWGYNFYRLENQLRADDILVRGKVGWLLGLARASIEEAESVYRRAFLPPPSREKPRPDANAVAEAQALELLSRAIGAIEGQIRAAGAGERPDDAALPRRGTDASAPHRMRSKTGRPRRTLAHDAGEEGRPLACRKRLRNSGGA
jgi:hypothetical protein